MKADPILIQRPERQKPLQRLTFAVITMIAWTFWVSLWMPVLTLIAWVLGLKDAFVKLGFAHPLEGAADMLGVVIAGVVSALIFGSWALYNHRRFAGRQKRQGNRPVGISETARGIGASLDTAERMQAERRSVVQFTDDGQMFLDVRDTP